MSDTGPSVSGGNRHSIVLLDGSSDRQLIYKPLCLQIAESDRVTLLISDAAAKMESGYIMSFTVNVNANHHKHAVVCRDTMDGRVSIEHQTFDGSRICDTELVAVVEPADVSSHVQRCERSLGLKGGASATSFGTQTQVFSGSR